MNRVKRYIFSTLIVLFIALAITPAQGGQNYDYRDDSFVKVSSQDCGSKERACVIAAFTGMLVSMNDSRLGTNITEIADKLKTYSDYYQNPNDPNDDGATLNGTINATTYIWGDGDITSGRTLDKTSITNATNPPPPKDVTYPQDGVTMNDHSGRYPTAAEIAKAITEKKKCSVGFVRYDYSKNPWEVIWAHIIRIVAIDATGTEWTDAQGVKHKKTRVLIYDPFHDSLIDTHIEEVGNGPRPTYVYIGAWGQWNLLEDLACISVTKNGNGGGKGGGPGTPKKNPPGGGSKGGGTAGSTKFQCSAGDPNFDPNNPSNVCEDNCPDTDYCDSTACKCLPLPSCGEWQTVVTSGVEPDGGSSTQVCKPDDNDCPPNYTCNDKTCQCE